MKNVKKLLVIFVVAAVTIANAQTAEDPKKLFDQAETYYVADNFAMALPLYLKLFEQEKDNGNIAYKIGNC